MLVAQAMVNRISIFFVPMIFLLFLTSGMGMIVSGLSVKFQDVTHLYSVFTMVLMYATPLFYPIEAVPPQVAALIRLNPMYVFITLFRELLLYGRMPGVGMWLSGAAMAALVFALGAWVFSRLQKTFIYYI